MVRNAAVIPVALLLFISPSSCQPAQPELIQNDTVAASTLPDAGISSDTVSDSTPGSGTWRSQDALLDSVTDDAPGYASEAADSTIGGEEKHPSVTDSASETGDSTAELSFDFGITRDNDFNFWPLLRYYRSMDKSNLYLDIALSLYRRQYDRNAGTEHQHLLPFYWHSQKKDGSDTRWLSFFYPSMFRYGTAREGKLFYFSFLELAPQINAMSLMKSDDGLFMRNNLLFLLWQKNDRVSGSSYLVFFPALWWFANREYSSFTLVPFYSHGASGRGNSKYSMVSPLYWRFASEARKQTAIVPFWWDREVYSREDTVSTKLLLPLYWSKKSREQHDDVLFPLVWRFSDDSYRSITIPPFWSSGSSPDGVRNHRMISLLYWKSTTRRKQDIRLYPLWWHTTRFLPADTEKTDLVLPLYWSKNRNAMHDRVVFPVYWHHDDAYRWSTTVPPFFSRGVSTFDSTRYFMAGTLFWHRESPGEVRNTLYPLWWQHRTFNDSGTTVTNYVAPVYWSMKTDSIGVHILFPLVWNFRNWWYSSTTVLPLFSIGSKPDHSKKHLMFGMLYWRFSSPEDYSNTLFPVWWQGRTIHDADTTRFNQLLPFWWSRTKNDVRERVFFPIVWSLHKPRFDYSAVLPFYSYYQSSDGSSFHRMAASLYWHFRSPEREYTTLFPLWWKNSTYDSADTVTVNRILPLYWSRVSRYGNRHTLFPVVWQRSERIADDTVHSLLALPVYYSLMRNEDLTRIIFPLLWIVKNQRYESVTVPPLVSYGHSPTGDAAHLAVTPLFWHFADTNGYSNTLFPLWWQREQWTAGDTSASTLLLPVYWSKRTGEISDHVVFPFVWNFRNARYRSTTVVPFCSFGASADGTRNHLMITPALWHFRSPSEIRTTLYPLWWHYADVSSRDTVTTDFIMPVWWSKRSSFVNDKVFFPLLWSLRDSSYRSLTVAPLFSCGVSAGGQSRHIMVTPLFRHTRSESGTATTLFPLWWKRTAYQEDDTVTSNLILPLYWSKRRGQEHHSVLFPLFWNHEDPLHQSTTLLPFFSKGASTDGLNSHFMTAMLYWRFRSMNEEKTTLFPLWWANATFDGTDTTRAKLLLPLYWSKRNRQVSDHVVFPLWWDYARFDGTDTTSSRLVLPLYWSRRGSDVKDRVVFPLVWSFDNSWYRSLSVIPFYSAGTSTSGDRRYRAVTPLYWSFRNGDARDRYLFPFMHYSEKGESETACNVLFMLYRYERNLSLSSHSFIWPIANVTNDTNYCSWRIAPVFWYKRSPQRHYFSVQPLFYLGGNESADHFNILWKVFSHTDEHSGGTSTSFLFNAFYVNRYAGDDHEVRLLYRLYADVKKDGTVEKSFFPFYRSVEEDDGEKSVSALFSIYKYVKKRYPGTSKFYQEDKLFWFIRLRSNYRALQERYGAQEGGK